MHHGFIDMDGQHVLSHAERLGAWEADVQAAESRIKLACIREIMARARREIAALDPEYWPVPGYDQPATLDMLDDMGGMA